MARSYASVGQMLTYAVERSGHSSGVEEWGDGRTRAEIMLRYMLEFVLMAPRSRAAFLRTVARTELSTGTIMAAPRLRAHAPDLIAEMLPSSGAADDGARLGIALSTDGALQPARLTKLRDALGSSPHHLLIAISRKADHRALDGELPDGVVTTSWSRLRARMVKADAGHAPLWDTIGEIGEHSGRPIAQFPVDARKLLTKGRTAREFRAHLDVMQNASRTLLGTSAHFSTRRGQTAAHLQSGVSLQRTGLDFGEVEHGSPVRFLRRGAEPVPLGIGLLGTDEERTAAQERLDQLARRTAWRAEHCTPPTPQELIGTAASPEVEGARLLLWAVLNPMLLRDRGFDPAPSRRQPALTATHLGLRLLHRGEDRATTYRIWVGGDRDWHNLIPKVTREETPDRPAETYAIAPRKSQSTADFVWEVHRALRSLTIV